MDDTPNHRHWPALEKDDAGLKTEIEELLIARAVGYPYSTDGSFAPNIVRLPPGLRALAATHWLEISLTVDSITWHYGNFEEPQLVVETEAGLRELGLHGLASCFVEANELMNPLLARRTEPKGDPGEIVKVASPPSMSRRREHRARLRVHLCAKQATL